MEAFAMEPFKIKMVEPIRITSREERAGILEEAGYNTALIRADKVLIDLCTDSGTGAMSSSQWAAMMLGDESYAGAASYYRLLDVCREIFGYKFFQPVHQGRAAENVLFELLFQGEKKYAISNAFFDTTRAHAQFAGAQVFDFPVKEALDSEADYPFKGNIDVDAAEAKIKEIGPGKIGFIIMTLTNNALGGQPVSMQNMKDISAVARKYGITLLIDAARFAENAYFVKQREAGYRDKSIAEIVRETFQLADGFTMSAKKDAIVNIGGLVGIKDNPDLERGVIGRVIPYEGFITYGGLAGRDLEALAVGLKEGMDYDYLKYRVGQVERLGHALREMGVPIQYPVGGHGVFVDAGKLLPQIPADEFPGVALANELYVDAGVRGSEIGSFCLGYVDPKTGKEVPAPMEFLRLAVPRRVYTQSHMDYVVDAFRGILAKKNKLKGYKIVWQLPILRYFTARLKPL